MSTAELKLDIITEISALQDIRIIEEIKTLLDFESDKNVFKLSELQKKRIIEAQNDEVISEEVANQQISEWLNEK